MSSINEKVVAHWRLNDAADANRVDSGPRGLHLTRNGAVALDASGKFGGAAAFDGNSANYLARASEAALQAGGESPGWVFWYRLAAGQGGILISKSSPTSLEYEIRASIAGATAGRLLFTVYSSGNPGGVTASVPVGAPGAWHMGAADIDEAAGTIRLQVDDGTPATASYTGTINNGAAELRLGRREYDGAFLLTGALDSVTLFKPYPTDAERLAIWLRGGGQEYPFTLYAPIYAAVRDVLNLSASALPDTDGALVQQVGSVVAALLGRFPCVGDAYAEIAGADVGAFDEAAGYLVAARMPESYKQSARVKTRERVGPAEAQYASASGTDQKPPEMQWADRASEALSRIACVRAARISRRATYRLLIPAGKSRDREERTGCARPTLYDLVRDAGL